MSYWFGTYLHRTAHTLCQNYKSFRLALTFQSTLHPPKFAVYIVFYFFFCSIVTYTIPNMEITAHHTFAQCTPTHLKIRCTTVRVCIQNDLKLLSISSKSFQEHVQVHIVQIYIQCIKLWPLCVWWSSISFMLCQPQRQQQQLRKRNCIDDNEHLWSRNKINREIKLRKTYASEAPLMAGMNSSFSRSPFSPSKYTQKYSELDTYKRSEKNIQTQKGILKDEKERKKKLKKFFSPCVLHCEGVFFQAAGISIKNKFNIRKCSTQYFHYEILQTLLSLHQNLCAETHVHCAHRVKNCENSLRFVDKLPFITFRCEMWRESVKWRYMFTVKYWIPMHIAHWCECCCLF